MIGCSDEVYKKNVAASVRATRVSLSLARNTWLAVPQGSWLEVHGSCLKARGSRLMAHASSLRVKVFKFQSCKVSFRLSDQAPAAEGFLFVFHRVAFVGQHLSVSIYRRRPLAWVPREPKGT